MVTQSEELTFEERLEKSKNKPKAKINVSVNKEDLEEFKRLLNKHFPETTVSAGFNEMLIDGLKELRDIDDQKRGGDEEEEE